MPTVLPDRARAICFDIGGVLVDMPRGPLATELALILDADVEQVRDLLIEHGKRRRSSVTELAVVLSQTCGAPGQQARVEAALRHRHCDMAASPLYPDAIPALEALERAGWRICMLTNAIGDTAAVPSPHYYRFAEVVVHSWDIGHCKPDPQAFQAVEQRMGLAPDQIIKVGDSVRFDVHGALAAGWSAIHLRRDARPSLAAATTIRSLAELPALLGAPHKRKAPR